MSSALESRTSPTLLGRLRQQPCDEDAWREFVIRYGKKIYRWCLRWDLQETDAQDVTQVVLLNLARKMRSFAYDPGRSFRAWLKTLTHHALYDFVEARKAAGLKTYSRPDLDLISRAECREDLLNQLCDEFDRELLEEAKVRVQLRVEPATWQAFARVALDGEPGAEVAEALGMNVGAVWMARHRVLTMLQQEVARLGGLNQD